MTFTPHGKHLIAGEWIATAQTFASEPAHGPTHAFSMGTADLVNRAAEAAEAAFWSYGHARREARAAFLDAIADEIEARAEAITEIGSQETGLPAARLQGERGRTTGQLRLFADHIRAGGAAGIGIGPEGVLGGLNGGIDQQRRADAELMRRAMRRVRGKSLRAGDPIARDQVLAMGGEGHRVSPFRGCVWRIVELPVVHT